MSERAKVRFYFFLIASLSIALVVSLVIGACFFISLRKKDKTESIGRYKLSIGLVDTALSNSTVSSKNIMRGDVMCTSFTLLSEKCGYTKVTNGNEIRYYLNNNDNDMMLLVVGSDVAKLNGNPVHLSTPVYKKGEILYVPMDLIINYFGGISVTVDDEKATILIEYIDPKECFLKLKAPETTTALDKAEF